MQNLKSHFWRDFFAYYTRPVNVHLAMVWVGCLFSNFSVFLLCFTQHKITWNLCFPVSIFQYGHIPPVKSKETVGNSWTVLSYFGSQISSQSLNEVHICRLQPKSTTKGGVLCVCVCVCVCVCAYFCLCFELVSRIANGERRRWNAARWAASLNKLQQLKNHRKCMKKKKMQSENMESWVWLSCQNRHKRQHAPTQTDIQRQKYMEKNHLLLRILM